MIRFDHRAVPIVLAAVVIDVIGFGIVMPVLPSLVTQLGHAGFGEATRIAGWMLTVFGVAQFFAGPALGALGDRFGRGPVLIAAMAGFSLDYLLMAAAPTLARLFLGRAIAGVAGATFGPAGAVIADVIPADRRASVSGDERPASRLVDETRQGAWQGGLGGMDSVAAIVGPLLAAQSLSFGAARGFDGAAFLPAGGLMTGAMLFIALGAPLAKRDD